MRRQRGYLLPLLLATMFVGSLLWGIDFGRLELDLRKARIERTREALAEARQGLQAYSMTYDLGHVDNPRVGLLPCPDLDNDGTAELTCGTASDFAIGRLPYRTLALPRLLDGDGECLWYVVAANTKAAGGGLATPMNWDTPGQLAVLGNSGVPLTDPTDPHGAAIAIVIAAGPPLAGQQRSLSSGACNGGAATASERAAFVEADTSSGAGFVQGHSTRNDNNDSLVWLGRRDIFGPLQRSGHFKAFVDGLLAKLATDIANAVLPAPDRIDGGDSVLEWGSPPSASTLGLVPDTADYIRFQDWQEMFRYARCLAPTGPVPLAPPACLTVNGTACTAMLIFAGARGPLAQRSATAVAEYLEEPTVTALNTLSTNYQGATGWDPQFPARDLFACIP